MCNSRSGTIFLFPCAPTGLDVGFKELQARGGFLVTAERKGGNVTYALVKSRRSGPCAVMNPWPGQTLYVIETPGGSLVPATVAGNKYTFPTTAGHSYALSTSAVGIRADRGKSAVPDQKAPEHVLLFNAKGARLSDKRKGSAVRIRVEKSDPDRPASVR